MRLHILALLMIAAIGLGRAPVAGQTLADVAKKEEERRKTAKPADKTYTNKDLGTLPPGTPSPAPAKPAASTDATAKETGKPAEQEKEKEPVKDQAYWAGRMKELHTQLERDQTYADAMQTRINALTTDFVNRDDPAQRAVIAQRPPEGDRRARSAEEADRGRPRRPSPTSKKKRAAPAFRPAGCGEPSPCPDRHRSSHPPRRRQRLAARDAAARARGAGPHRHRSARPARSGAGAALDAARASCCRICGCPKATASACCAPPRSSIPSCR